MTFKEYQEFVTALAFYDHWEYPYIGLSAEAGEVMGKLSKYRRGDYSKGPFANDKEIFEGKVKPELGDCLWMITAACNELGITLEELAEQNVAKLLDRQNRGVLMGEGDER